VQLAWGSVTAGEHGKHPPHLSEGRCLRSAARMEQATCSNESDEGRPTTGATPTSGNRLTDRDAGLDAGAEGDDAAAVAAADMRSVLLETAGAAGLSGQGRTPSAVAVAATVDVASLRVAPAPAPAARSAPARRVAGLRLAARRGFG
jgi:hypothetical protein